MLMAISAVGEGCQKQVQPILGDVVQAVLPYCQDSVSRIAQIFEALLKFFVGMYMFFPPQHPRVRYAACNALGQLANDFAPTLQLKYHSKVRRSFLT